MPSGMGLIRIKKKDPAELSALAGEGYSKQSCVIPRGKPIPDTSRNGSRWHKRWEGWSHREAEGRGDRQAWGVREMNWQRCAYRLRWQDYRQT